jgi:hypothetical protein
MVLQLIGYAASVLIMISLMTKSLVKLRCLNAVGSIIFVIFALTSASYPTAVLNLGIVIIDVYNLVKLLNKKESFDIVPVSGANEIVSYFYTRNKAEIDSLFGSEAVSSADKFAFYFRNNDIAGFTAYTLSGDSGEKTALITADFVAPRYRDSAIGTYFFVKNPSFWKEQHISTLVSKNSSKTHIPYLKKIGFTAAPEQTGTWQKKIS